MGAQHRIDGAERIVEGPLHEHLPQRLQDEDLAPARVLKDAVAAPRRLAREVQRPQDARLAVDEGHHVLLVEGVVAQRHAVGAGVEGLAPGDPVIAIVHKNKCGRRTARSTGLR